MPKFSKADFTMDNATRLSVIIMSKMGKNPLLQFKSLPLSQQQKFNRLMNIYIASLGEDWVETLHRDFNLIVQEDIITEDFDASKVFIQSSAPTTRELLLTEEQKEFLEQRRIELGEEEIKV
jgi:hypothetical protein